MSCFYLDLNITGKKQTLAVSYKSFCSVYYAIKKTLFHNEGKYSLSNMSYSLRWLRSASHQFHACWWLCKCSYLPHITWLLLCLWCWLEWQISFLLPCIWVDFHWLNKLVWRIIMIAQQEEAMISWAKLWNQYKKFRLEIQRNRKTWLTSSYISCVKASAVECRSITSIVSYERVRSFHMSQSTVSRLSSTDCWSSVHRVLTEYGSECPSSIEMLIEGIDRKFR